MSYEQFHHTDNTSTKSSGADSIGEIARQAYDTSFTNYDWHKYSGNDTSSVHLPNLFLDDSGSSKTPNSSEASMTGAAATLLTAQEITSELKTVATEVQAIMQQFQLISQQENAAGAASTVSGEAATAAPPTTSSGEAQTAIPANTSSSEAQTAAPPNTSSGEAQTAAPPNTSSGEAQTATPPTTGSGEAQTTAPPNTSTSEAQTAIPPNTSTSEAQTAIPPTTGSGEAQTAAPPNTSSGEAAGATGNGGTTVNLGDGAPTGTGTSSTTGGDSGTTVGLGSSSSSGNAGFIGFFGGDTDAQEADSISSALGKTAVPSTYLDYTQPAAQTTQYNIGQYASWVAANPGTGMIVGVPLTFDGQTLSSTASGANNSEFTQLAQQLVAAGQGNDTIRLGIEMNGSWATDNNDGNPTDFINAYNNAAEAMKAVPGANFKFDWNPSDGEQNNIPTEDYYPGNANVDSIGVDVYDWNEQNGSSATPAQTWNLLTTEPGGLNELAAFAQQQGKPFAIPEYAVSSPEGQAGNPNATSPGMGDDPSFINNIASFLNTQANKEGVAFQSYFDSPSGGVGTTLETSPNSYQAYLQDFGNGGIDGAET